MSDASKGEGRDYGIGFSFFDNKLSGSLKRHKSQSIMEGGQGLVEPVFVNPNNDVMASFDYYYRQAGVSTFAANDPIRSIDELRTTLSSGANGYLSNRVSKGFEFELIANPTRTWAVRASYSHNERTRTNVLEEGVGWWAERDALWESLDALYVRRTGRASIYNQTLSNRSDAFTNQTVAERIADSDRELAATRFREQQGYGNRKHKAAPIWQPRWKIPSSPETNHPAIPLKFAARRNTLAIPLYAAPPAPYVCGRPGRQRAPRRPGPGRMARLAAG